MTDSEFNEAMKEIQDRQIQEKKDRIIKLLDKASMKEVICVYAFVDAYLQA